jgi:hypothetical protein
VVSRQKTTRFMSEIQKVDKTWAVDTVVSFTYTLERENLKATLWHSTGKLNNSTLFETESSAYRACVEAYNGSYRPSLGV